MSDKVYFICHILILSRGLTESNLSILQGRGKVVYILPSSDPTLTLLLVGFTEYDDNNDMSHLNWFQDRFGSLNHATFKSRDLSFLLAVV
ncbi:hypothetical protein Hanom_Chr08g00682881 [Helianthus anomalus]